MPRRPTLAFRRKAHTPMNRRSSADAEEIHFPDVENDPRVLAEIQKHNAITSRLRELEEELESIPPTLTNAQQRAELILAGRDPGAEDAAGIKDRRRIAQAIADHERAAKMQAQRIEAARVLVRREARLPLMPHHSRLAHNIADALDALAEAVAAEVAFRDELDRHGIEHGAPMLPGTLPINGCVGLACAEELREQARRLRADHPSPR